MRLSLVLLLIFLWAIVSLMGCGQSTEYSGPKPFLTPPDNKIYFYDYWECPEGYEVQYSGYHRGSDVFCVGHGTENREMEDYMLSMKPKGKAK
jgi:hypothetical protein